MKMNTQQSKLTGHSKGGTEREVHSNTDLPKKDRNKSNKQPNQRFSYRNWRNNNKQSLAGRE